MKKTIFNSRHHELNARMVEFAGYEMPLEYEGILKEHHSVRRSAGLFDVSHMGEIWIKGEMAHSFMQRVSSNDINALGPGKAQYSCLPNGIGGIIDDLIVYQYDEMKFLLVVNAANIRKDWEWLNQQNNEGVILENASEKISQLAVQGPNAKVILQKITPLDLDSIKTFQFQVGQVGSVREVIVAATGYTGSGGFELYFENEGAIVIWDELLHAGREFDIKPIGLAARDTLRLEMGFCLYGNDIDDTTSPIEAGLGWITKLSQGKNLIDKDILTFQKQHGVQRKLIGFEMDGRAIPRHGYEITDSENNLIGKVTSGTMSPSLNKGIGMGYVAIRWCEPGSEIYIDIRNKKQLARVVKLPFLRIN